MDDVKVLVQVFWRGSIRKEIVEVPEEAFAKRCWKPIAALKAGVMIGIPFTDMLDKAKFGLLPEDKARLAELIENGGQICRATEEVQDAS